MLRCKNASPVSHHPFKDQKKKKKIIMMSFQDGLGGREKSQQQKNKSHEVLNI